MTRHWLTSRSLLLGVCLLAGSCVHPGAARPEPVQEDLEGGGPILDLATYQNYSLGIGIGAKAGDRVFAMIKGTVRRFSDDAGNRTNFGRFVETAHTVVDKRSGKSARITFYILYSQLSSVTVRRNSEVRKGESIGFAGGSSPFSDRKELLLCLYSERDEPYLRELTGSGPLYLLGYFWWDPASILAASLRGR
ncbi:MAG: peptidoglycan DD-metalloendopeptidase family protein [Spirochaetes bacterium]|nr:peptidoglycan DD-metalloendopeptidase family protein [Spirochaetota bacterium]